MNGLNLDLNKSMNSKFYMVIKSREKSGENQEIKNLI